MLAEKIIDNIFKIVVPLPMTPLKSLNAYVIRGERNLLIDTGFNHDVSEQALLQGLDGLGVRLEDTDIFITHLHSDHSGLAWKLQRPGTKVYISRKDWEYIDVDVMEQVWRRSDGVYACEGFPQYEMDKMPLNNVARSLSPTRNCDFTHVSDDDILEYGGHRLRVVGASGHSPGQKCLFEEDTGTMFLGDHILFDITPTVQIWDEPEDSLTCYMEALRRFRGFNIKNPLPGHRGVSCTADERIGQILEHHRLRLEETVSVVSAHRGMTAYEIASHMTWHIRARSWDDFPISQKWFAVGEILAHLRYLENTGEILRYEEGGLNRYVCSKH